MLFQVPLKRNKELKTGDKIYLNETIVAGAGSGNKFYFRPIYIYYWRRFGYLDTFIASPATNDGKIVASVKQGSLKVVSGLISKKILMP